MDRWGKRQEPKPPHKPKPGEELDKPIKVKLEVSALTQSLILY